MKTALVLGGAASVWQDAADACAIFTPDVVVAVNEIGTRWAGRIDIWATLHPEHMAEWQKRRAAAGLAPAACHIAHTNEKPGIDRRVDHRWPEMPVGVASGSSGLYGAKVLIDLDLADAVVVAGVPMTPTPHFNRSEDWTAFRTYTKAWEACLPRLKGRVFSMSGWTRELLGSPSADLFHA